MGYLLYLMFRCDWRYNGCDGKFGNLVGTKHTPCNFPIIPYSFNSCAIPRKCVSAAAPRAFQATSAALPGGWNWKILFASYFNILSIFCISHSVFLFGKRSRYLVFVRIESLLFLVVHE